MLQMRARRVRRKCGVRGCRSTDCYAISRTREVGGTVIICRKCLEDALGAVQPLKVEVAPAEAEPVPDVEASVGEGEKNAFVCPKCGREYKTEQGLQKHLQVCTGGDGK